VVGDELRSLGGQDRHEPDVPGQRGEVGGEQRGVGVLSIRRPGAADRHEVEQAPLGRPGERRPVGRVGSRVGPRVPAGTVQGDGEVQERVGDERRSGHRSPFVGGLGEPTSSPCAAQSGDGAVLVTLGAMQRHGQ
jgi:hypothetical protein